MLCCIPVAVVVVVVEDDLIVFSVVAVVFVFLSVFLLALEGDAILLARKQIFHNTALHILTI